MLLTLRMSEAPQPDAAAATAAADVQRLLPWHLLLTLWMCEAQHVEPLSRLQVLAWDRLPRLHGCGCARLSSARLSACGGLVARAHRQAVLQLGRRSGVGSVGAPRREVVAGDPRAEPPWETVAKSSASPFRS